MGGVHYYCFCRLARDELKFGPRAWHDSPELELSVPNAPRLAVSVVRGGVHGWCATPPLVLVTVGGKDEEGHAWLGSLREVWAAGFPWPHSVPHRV